MLSRSTVIMFATAAVLLGMFVTMKAFTLSGEQVVDRDLGRFANLLDLSVVSNVKPGGGIDVTAEVTTAARGSGADEVTPLLMSFDIRPDIPRPPLTIYLEGAWSRNLFPGRYVLTQGRWPSLPGEVALTRSFNEAAAAGGGDVLPVLSGNERWTVVGIVDDRFEATPRILAAEGTWASISPTTVQRFPTLTAAAMLLWNGADAQDVISAVGQVLTTGTELESSPAEAIAQLSAGLRTRDTELVLDRRSWIERIPLAYQIPSLALPALAVAAIFGLNHRRFRRSLTVLLSVGMNGRDATGALAVAISGWILLSAAAGALTGVCLGALARPVADRFLPGPISPFPSVGGPLVRLLVITTVSCLVAAVGLYLATRQPVRPSPATPSSHQRSGSSLLRTLRRFAALATASAAIGQIPSMDTVPKSMIFAGTLGAVVLLFTPDLVSTAIRLLPTTDPRARLGRQQLIKDKNRAVAAVAILTAVLGAPLAMLTLLATLIDSARDDIVPMVAPHQLVLSSPAGHMHPPTPETIEIVTAALPHARPPIQVAYGWTDQVKASIAGGGKGTLLIVDSIDDVARLNNGPLIPQQVDILQRGGMLVWTDTGSDQRALINHNTTNGQRTTTHPIPAAHSRFQPAWQTSVGGLLLTATANRLGLPVRPAAVVFTNITTDQATTAKQAILNAGLDPSQVGIPEPPDPIRVPTAFYGTVIGLAAIVLITTTAVARTQVITLRSYLGRLISIGLSTTWARQVLLLQTALVIALSTILALLIAVPAVTIAALRLPGLSFFLPWHWLGLTLAAYYTATITATLLSTRSLRPTDRLTV